MSNTPCVLSAQIAHETNTFSVVATTLDDYRARQLYQGVDIADAMAGTHTEMAAHLQAAQRHGWHLVQPVAAFATPSGRTTASAWGWLLNQVLEAARCAHPRGVLLALHGAMVVEGEDDAEGALLEDLRRIVGPDVPIAVTLDLHANVSERMAEHANALIGYRTYPHIDQFDVGALAADLLQHMLVAKQPVHATVVRPASLLGCNHGRSAEGPMRDLRALADHYEQRAAAQGQTLHISVFAGFPWADIADSGPSVVLCGTLSIAAMRQIGRLLCDEIVRTREVSTVPVMPLAHVAALVSSATAAPPVVLADFTDNPGHGGYGDHVGLLRLILAHGDVQASGGDIAIGCIHDPAAVVRCQQAGMGAHLTLALGSHVDPRLYGEPVTLDAVVESLSDGRFVCSGPVMTGLPLSLGATAVVRHGRLRVIVTTHNVQVFDQQVFISQGIVPAHCAVLIVKSAHHFRGAFEPLASAVHLVDTGGLATHDLSRLHYTRVRRPIWPLDTAES